MSSTLWDAERSHACWLLRRCIRRAVGPHDAEAWSRESELGAALAQKERGYDGWGKDACDPSIPSGRASGTDDPSLRHPIMPPPPPDTEQQPDEGDVHGCARYVDQRPDE